MTKTVEIDSDNKALKLLKDSQRVAKIGSWNLDLETQELYWSNQTYALFDKPTSFTPSFNEFARLVHPDDSELMHARFNEALANDDTPYHVVVRVINDSKREWIMEAFGAVERDDSGKTIRIAGTAQDVTERKWAEKIKAKNKELIKAKNAAEEDKERLNFVLEGSKLGFWDWNIVTNEVQRNKYWAEMLGYTLDEIQFTVNQWTDLIHPDEIEMVTKALDDHIKGKHPYYQVEYRMRTKDDQWKWILDKAKVVKRDNQGNPIRMTGTHSDITELKRNEEQIKQYAEDLKELNATKDKFFSILAHDLRSPFNAILGFTELLCTEAELYPPEKIKKFCQTLHTSTKQVYNLLESLLEWSRLQTGTIQPEFKKIAPENTINEVLSVLKPMAVDKKIHLLSEISSNTPSHIVTDNNMLLAILRNLISNALKFTHPDGVVKVKTENNDDTILFSVSDTGEGIEPEHLESLFRIDNKLSKTGTNNEKGTGLGLILCNEFVNKLNGNIWVDSEFGKGSTFYFSLPKS